MQEVPRILIVTAAFGEGHNSAARNLALALDAAGVKTQVSDPCMLAVPRLTRWVNFCYRFVTVRLPYVWERIYRSTDRCDFSKQKSLAIRMIERKLAELMKDFKPDAIVSTYPLYPYLLTWIFEKTGGRKPVFTVVTDSMEINAAWLRTQSDHWLVTDAGTRHSMVEKGLPASRIQDSGFPVHPDFARLQPVDRDDPCDVFRVLYFPTSSLTFLRRHGKALLEASPSVRLTVILGKNVRHLYPKAREIQLAYPGRVRLIGWTRRVPALLNRHHLVVGKAGGATVHEAIAARCPMLIHHLVPGQEVGNLRLLETIGGGQLASSPDALNQAIKHLLEQRARRWRNMKDALVRHNQNSGALNAAQFILANLDEIQHPIHLKTPAHSLCP
jgi:processive 1,2-diacylglycerol beta-glucosyltransferase